MAGIQNLLTFLEIESPAAQETKVREVATVHRDENRRLLEIVELHRVTGMADKDELHDQEE